MKFEKWIHLGNNYRAVLDGYGEDTLGYNYDIIVSPEGFEGRVENKGDLIKRKIFTRKESVELWLTKIYKNFND